MCLPLYCKELLNSERQLVRGQLMQTGAQREPLNRFSGTTLAGQSHDETVSDTLSHPVASHLFHLVNSS